MPAPTDPTPETSASPGYALLIGIDHYDNLDPSAELPGSRNDVLMWYRFCRNHLGIPVENIRMLTSPPLDPKKDFGDDIVPSESLGGADEASIRDGYTWLLTKMDGGKSPGLLTYSGHGMVVDGRPALSTASLGGNGAGAILLRDLRDAVSKAKAEQALTAIFDCCHVVAPAAQSHLRRSTGLVAGGQTAPEIVDEAFNVSHRVLLAARPGQAAYQCNLGERFHGALSFALVTTAEQWKATNAPGQTGLDVDYRDLFKRARKLLRALRMKQSPKLRVPFDPESRRLVRRLPFFGTEARATSRKPDAPRVLQQIPPDWFITIVDATGTILAQIITCSSNFVVSQTIGGVMNTLNWSGPSTEFWYINTTALKSLSSNAKISVTSKQLTNRPTVPLDSKTAFAFGQNGTFGWPTYMAVAPTPWTPGAPAPFPSSNSYYFTASPADGPIFWVQFVLPKDDETILTTVQWYQVFQSTPTSAPTSIQPDPTNGSGTEYTSSRPPTSSSLSYSALSWLNRE